ncbi:type I secretion system permease/ATPase [Wolbachia endosymbiont of Dipetalonema caudispina]|uniref:type I secretion system permease/ATPase n=1 Tax=Wolbachia endosymbiont of Dipetalonema caudispina TaxID=1812112 RepID=UPI001588351A|nr:type I secretion system permease/ATPase [Wolbachia endosymbiont of Dipetalonema caudispina]QKX00912.1 type I secretion system permease/ATPase [Wolbachia endosymbiont of Dipetalonema caudispina]
MEVTTSTKKELKQSTLYICLEKCTSAFWFIFWFSSGINLLMLFLPLYTSQVLDRVISSGSISTLIMLTIITLSAFACSAVLETCRYLAMTKIGDWIDRTVAPDLIVRSIRLTSVQSSTSSGEAIRDLGVIKSFIMGNGIFSLFDTPWSLIYLIVIFIIHTSTGFIAVIGIIMLISMATWNEFATKRILQEINEESLRNINAIDIATRNAEVVEAMGMSEFIVSDWCKQNDQTRMMQIKAQNRSSIITGITKFLRSTLQISVIGMGALLAITAHKTAGNIIAASILMGRVLAPFDAAVHTWKFLNQAMMSYGRLQRLILTSPKREQTLIMPEPKGKLEFDRVFFTPYRGNKPTIKGMSFVIESGDIVGVVGASASGKSTIAKLIVGVWKPISGVVRLDGADVYTWNRRDFGNYVGYLPQDVELFNTSIKANIARMRPNPDFEEVIKAAKIAGIHELILGLPNGYDTVIGSFGVTLSGGQKQLLGLARAFYGNIKLLVLDEPNANLDSNGEACLIKAIDNAKKQNITTVIITHKLLLVSLVDKVIFISEGTICAIGPKDEILGKLVVTTLPNIRGEDEQFSVSGS